MKYKKIMLITLLLLAVLTIGAVSASDDVASDDSVAASDEGVDESPVSEATSDEEVLADSPYEENGFDPIVAKTIELDNDEDAVVDINTPDEGNFTIYVTDSDDETSEFNHEIDEDDVKEGYITWDLDDLDITEEGIYILSAKYVNDTGSIWVFENHKLIVTEDPMVTFADEFFDVKDAQEPIVSIYCPEGLTGIFLVKLFEEYEEDWMDCGCEANHTIVGSDYDDYVDFTVSSFNKEINVGYYKFRVYLLDDESDEPDDDINKIASEELSAVDSTQFWSKVNDELSLTSIDPVVSVFCPDGSTGTVVVTVRKGEEEKSYQKDASDSQENWLEWTLRDLGIDSEGKYLITVEANNTILKNAVEVNVESPIRFNDEVSYLKSDNPERAFMVEVEIPSEITGGRIIITSNGAEIFNMTLSGFSDKESVDAPYWSNPHHGPGDESIKVYTISSNNVNPEFNEGTYELTVIANVDGLGKFNNTGEVRFAKANTKKDDDNGVEITIYDAIAYGIDDDWNEFIEITASDSAEGEIRVTVEGTDFIEVISLDDFDDGYYSLVPNDFEDLGAGTYNIAVAYWKEGEEIFNNTAAITFVYGEGPSIWIPDWGVSVHDNDDVIYVYPNGDESDDIRIALTIDGVVYLNATVDELGLMLRVDDDDNEYYAVPANMLNRELSIGVKYENVIAYYYSDNFNVTSDGGEDPNTSLICVGMINEVEWNYTGAVISVYCSDYDYEHYMMITVDIGGGYGVGHIIKEGDRNNFINFTLENLGIGIGYNDYVEVGFMNGGGIFGGNIWVVNSSEFRAKTHWNVVLYNDPAAISVWCPQSSEGKTIRIYDKNDDERLFMEYTVRESDQGKYVDFTLNDLGIDKSGWYDLNFTVDGEEIDGQYGCNVHDIIEFNSNGIVTMSDEDVVFDSMLVAYLNVPYDFDDDITVTANGREIFDGDFDDLGYDEDDGFRRYTIYSFDLDDIDKDKYEIVITLDKGISKSAELTFADLNVVSNGNISIEMIPLDINYSDNDWDSYWNTYFAVVYTPRDGYDWGEVQVKVMLNNENYTVIFNDNDAWRSDIWDNGELVGYMYYIRPGDLRDSEGNSNIWGNFNVTVIYGEGTENEVRNNATLKVNRMPDIQVCYTGDWADKKAEYFLNQDIDVIHINYYGENPDLSGIRVVLTSGDAILIDDMVANLVYKVQKEYDGGYLIALNVTNLKNLGHFSDVLAVLHMGDYQARSDVYDDACTSFDVYWGHLNIYVSDEGKILPDGQLVDIYAPVDADGNITVMIGEEVFFEGTLKSLGEIQQFPDDIENKAGHYYLYLSNMSMHILPGHYDNFIVGYVGNDGYVTANIKSMGSKDYINVYGNSSIEFSHNIAFLTGGNGSASIDLVGATVSQDNISVEGHPEAVIHFENNVITVSNLTSGSYDLKVTTTPVSEYFYSVDGFAKIFVKDTKFDPDFSISIDNVVAGNPVSVAVSANEAFSGVVTVKVDGRDVLVHVKNGNGENKTTGVVLPFKDNYVANLTFEATDVFNAGTAETTFNVTAVDPDFSISIDNVVAGNPVSVAVSANEAFSGVVTVKVNGIDVLVSVKNGKGVNDTTGVVLPFKDNYVASLTFEATDVFKADTAETTFNVTAIDPDIAIGQIADIEEGNPVVVVVTANENFTGSFKVLIGDNVVANGTIAAGKGNATISADKLAVGTVTVKVTTDATDIFSAGMKTTSFNVTSKVVPARIIANDATTMYTSGYIYSVTVYGTDGALAKNTAVVIKINGKAVANVKTNDKGVATYKIVQAPGSYKITAEALGISVTKKLTVKHLLKLKKVKVKKSAKKLVIKVTLNKVNGKYLKGKKITLKFKGKKYKAKTNKKGVAKFTIKKKVLKKLKVGKKVKYQATYLKDTVKYTVKVKK